MLCYKYMPYERFMQSIKPTGVYLKVSRPAEFNDPYDCTGTVTGVLSQHLKDTYGNAFKQLLNPEELDLSVNVEGRRLFDGMYRILSMCDSSVKGTAEEMLMWSHYADCARGVRVGIEVDTHRYRLGVVAYEELVPQLDATKIVEWKIFDDPELRRFLKACLLTKHKIWEYEQERRVVFRVNDPCLKPFSVVDAAGAIYDAMMIWTPDKYVIKEVCLGSEFLQQTKSYREVDSYFNKLFDAGYDFKVCAAIKRRQYGYDVGVHETRKNVNSRTVGVNVP